MNRNFVTLENPPEGALQKLDKHRPHRHKISFTTNLLGDDVCDDVPLLTISFWVSRLAYGQRSSFHTKSTRPNRSQW